MATEREIDRRIERLRDEFGEFPVETGETVLDADSYARARELHDRGVPGAARVWVEREDEVLLVREENSQDSWSVAGGLIDPGERAEVAGEREVREETGVGCAIREVAYVHRAMRRHADGERDSFDEIAVAFVAEYVDGAIRAEDGEIADVAWWDILPENTRPPATRIAPERPG